MDNSYGEIGYLKKEIIALIGLVDTVQEVVNYEKTGFGGYPAVTVTCTGNANSFYSNAENERTFEFMIRTYVGLEKKPSLDSVTDPVKQKAEAIMERVVDQIINVFDTTTTFTLGGAADNGVEAIPSRWGYALLPDGWCRTAEIILRVKRTKLVA